MADVDEDMAKAKLKDKLEPASPSGFSGAENIKYQGDKALAVSDAVPRLPEYAKPGNYNTALAPQEEQEFNQWVQQNKIPFDPQAPITDYDMRGFYKALQSGDERATTAVNQNDKQTHFPDYWKTPYHKSFSAESQWADPEKAPRWNSKDQLVTPDGKVVYDERKEQMQRLDDRNNQNKSVLQDLKGFLNKHGLPTDVDQLLSGDYPLGVAALGKAIRQLHDLEQQGSDK